MRRPKSAKTAEMHSFKRASGPGLVPGRDTQSEDRQLAHAFDVIVPNAPVQAQYDGRFRSSPDVSEQAAASGWTAEEIVRELHAAQELAKKTQHEIEKRIREVRRQGRRAAA